MQCEAAQTGQNSELPATDCRVTQSRILQDFAKLDLPSCLEICFPEPKDLFSIELTITPDDALCRGESFKFTCQFGNGYPYSPPKIKPVLEISHSEPDPEGGVSLNILHESVHDLHAVMATLHGFILEALPAGEGQFFLVALRVLDLTASDPHPQAFRPRLSAESAQSNTSESSDATSASTAATTDSYSSVTALDAASSRRARRPTIPFSALPTVKQLGKLPYQPLYPLAPGTVRLYNVDGRPVVAKTGVREQEYRNMLYLQEHVPELLIPQVYGFQEVKRDDDGATGFLFLEYIPSSITLEEALCRSSDPASLAKHVGSEVAAQLKHLRSARSPTIRNVAGGFPAMPIAGSGAVPNMWELTHPFTPEREEEYYGVVARHHTRTLTRTLPYFPLPRPDSPYTLTHSDFAPRNILVDATSLNFLCLIDWASLSFQPPELEMLSLKFEAEGPDRTADQRSSAGYLLGALVEEGFEVDADGPWRKLYDLIDLS
ncbi:hypothetical protein JCM8097_001865 [Rhodosporidiobolus ruineniae]